MTPKFRIGDLVKVIENYERETGRVGRVADLPAPIKMHHESRRLGKYEGHVRVDPSGSNFYWVEFVDGAAGRTSASEIDEFALERTE